MLRVETRQFSPHDKVKDKVNEIFTYYSSFMVDLQRLKEFYETHDDDQVIGHDICDKDPYIARGNILANDVERLLRIHALDEQIVSRETLLSEDEPVHLQNMVATLTSEICRLRKIKEEVAQESVKAIHQGLQEEITRHLQGIIPAAIKKHCPQLEMESRLDAMLEARTKRMPR